MPFMASGVAHLLLLGCGLGVSRAASPEWSGVTKVLEAFDFLSPYKQHAHILHAQPCQPAQPSLGWL